MKRFGILILLLGFQSVAISASVNCLAVYKPHAVSSNRINSFLEGKNRYSSAHTFSEFVTKEMEELDRAYALVLARINQSGTDNRLDTLVESANLILEGTHKKIAQLTTEALSKRPDEKTLSRLQMELKECQGNMNMCQAALKKQMAELVEFFNDVQSIDELISRTQRNLESLHEELPGLAPKFASEKEMFSQILQMKLDSLHSYNQALPSFLEQQKLLVTTATQLAYQSIPLSEQEIIKLESRGFNIGAMKDYVLRVKDGGLENLASSKKKSARLFDRSRIGTNSPEGISFLEFLDDFHDQKYIETIRTNLIETFKMNSSGNVRYLTLKDAIDILEKMALHDLEFGLESYAFGGSKTGNVLSIPDGDYGRSNIGKTVRILRNFHGLLLHLDVSYRLYESDQNVEQFFEFLKVVLDSEKTAAIDRLEELQSAHDEAIKARTRWKQFVTEAPKVPEALNNQQYLVNLINSFSGNNLSEKWQLAVRNILISNPNERVKSLSDTTVLLKKSRDFEKRP
jgi:hypothetical protein